MTQVTGSLPNGVRQIGDGLFVSGQIAPGDIAAIAAAGCRTIICNRPDNESPGQPPAAQIEAEARKHGLSFHFIPVTHAGVTAAAVEATRQALSQADGPVFAYCRSGARSTNLLALSAG